MADSLRKYWIGRETVEGYPAAYYRMLPVVVGSIKPEPKDDRLTTQEYTGTLITDTNTVRLYKHGEFGFDFYQRFDLAGLPLAAIIQGFTSVLTGAGTSQAQTITISGTPTGGTFTLTFDGYTTAPITYSSTAATLQTNITNALAALPSINGSANISVSASATAPVVTFQGALQKANLPVMSAGNLALTGGTNPAISVAITTPGSGAYTHTALTGAPNKPTFTFIEYDGADYIVYRGARVNTADWSIQLKDAVKCSLKAISKFEQHWDGGAVAFSQTSSTSVSALSTAKAITVSSTAGLSAGSMLLCSNADGSNLECVQVTSVTSGTVFVADFRLAKSGTWNLVNLALPPLIQAGYQQPVDPSQIAVTINGAAFMLSKDAKISVKNNVDPINAIGAGADMVRSEEGFVQVEFEIHGRYVAFSGSQYQNYINNTAPGPIVFTATDTPTIGAASVPTWQLSLLNPKYESGVRNPVPKETEQTLKGKALLDAATAASLKAVLVNEVPAFPAS